MRSVPGSKVTANPILIPHHGFKWISVFAQEEGVGNTDVYNTNLRTQPEDIWDVYRPGNVRLRPNLLGRHRAHMNENTGGNPLRAPCHLGSPRGELKIRSTDTQISLPQWFWPDQGGCEEEILMSTF
ncbi:hypothetical protein BS17DRAFT_779752 [Gyrodon lividus]|nr:hypothetical protein BS17DRAFT_779752 [Gyrodon lividus]